jgi:hypothetical protein
MCEKLITEATVTASTERSTNKCSVYVESLTRNTHPSKTTTVRIGIYTFSYENFAAIQQAVQGHRETLEKKFPDDKTIHLKPIPAFPPLSD